MDDISALLFRFKDRFILYLAFAITGAVTNLLGPLLPVLEQQWKIDDQQAGELFTFQFAFSTLAAIFASRNLRVAAPLGMLLTACGVSLLTTGGVQTAKAAVMLFGAGLGLAITAINLMVGYGSPPGERSFEIARLNFIWVVGAISYPVLYSHLPPSGWRGLLVGTALLTAAAGVAIVFQFNALADLKSEITPYVFRPLSLLFAAFFFLYVGVEVGVAGWLSAYVDREAQGLSGATCLAVFWAALLAGRLVLPFLLRSFSHMRLVCLFVATALCALVALATYTTVPALLLGSGLVGLGLAPLFPLNLALFAHSIPSHKNAGWVLACGGLGASLLPAVMGIVSKHADSLRVAIVVPIMAVAVLIAIAAFYREPTQESRTPL